MIGKTGLQRTMGTPSMIYEERKRELRYPKAAQTYREMSTEAPVIASILYLCNSAIRSLSWTVQEGKSTTQAEAKANAKAKAFLETAIDGLETPWAQIVEESLSALVYGFCFFETVYKIDEKTGMVRWHDFAPRSQSSLLGWKYAGDNCTHYIQYDPVSGRQIEIPLSRGILVNINKTRRNPEGQSLLRSCYIPYKYIQQLQQIEAIGIERSMNGFPVITMPAGINLMSSDNEPAENAAIREEIAKMGEGIRNDSIDYIAKPEGWDIQLLTPDTNRAVDVDKTIQRYNSQIASSFSANIQDMSAAVNASAANVQQSLLNQALQTFTDNIAETFNQYAVKKLLELNGLTGDAKLVPGRIKQPSVGEVALMLRAMGGNINGDKELMNTLRTLLGLPLLDDKLFEDIYLPQATSESDKNDDGVSHDKSLESREFEQNDERYV